MFNLKKSFGVWRVKENGHVIYRGTLKECLMLIVEKSRTEV